MRSITIFVLFFLTFLILSIPGYSQTSYVVHVGADGLAFSPADLTIAPMDTVIWINAGGFHNVVADDNSFTSGAPSSSNWVYTHVFESAGDNPYYCVVHGGPGGSGMAGVIRVQEPTSVEEEGKLPQVFNLEQNYPNPFNPSTTIKFSLPESAEVTMKIFNSLGEEVALLVNSFKERGTYSVKFNSAGLPSGIYYYKLKAGNFSEVKKMILNK
ncbi:MAG TPA: T9SS type A sorting domain-containing protein [Ignavibacteriaceae bacterium]|nr:T9SS type A sorting domain-containing protein [Ignavibacteriaceae bacterium]